MKVTNKHGFHDIFLAVARNDKYSPGKADITTTQLIDSPLIRHLKRAHEDEIEQDISDLVYSIAGQGWHTTMERAAEGREDVIAEKRFYWDWDGVIVGGQIDLYDKENKVLWDYKEKSVWWHVWGDDGKEEAQQNVNAHLMRRNGYEIDRLALAVRYRDWQKSKENDEGYPDRPMEVVPIKLWEDKQADDYIRDRLVKHFQQKPDCTDEERWKKPDRWAVYKKGGKRAKRVFDSEEEARQYIEDALFATELDHRPGRYTRCENYCLVADFCPIWNAK